MLRAKSFAALGANAFERDFCSGAEISRARLFVVTTPDEDGGYGKREAPLPNRGGSMNRRYMPPGLNELLDYEIIAACFL